MINHKSIIDTDVRLVREADETVTKRGASSKGEKRKSQAQLTAVQRL